MGMVRKSVTWEDTLKHSSPKHSAILTNDPSLTAWGWAVLDETMMLKDHGCIKTAPEQKKRRIRKSDDTSRRASDITRELLRVIKKHDVKFILSESPHGSQNASAAVMIGLCCGITTALSEALEIPIEYYSEGDSKKECLGKLAATKDEMVARMTSIFGKEWKTGTKYIDEAVADALAVYVVASHQSTSLKLLRQ